MNKRFFLLLCLFFSTLKLSGSANDPFRWLEDENSVAVENWVLSQQKKTERYFEQVKEKERLAKALDLASAFDSWGLPKVSENGLFLSKMEKNAEKASLYFLSFDKKEKCLIQAPKEEGVVLTNFTASRDGKKVAYGLSFGGSDQETWYIYDIETEKNLSDTLEGIKFSAPIWAADGHSLFYVQEGHRLKQHRLGTPQKDDSMLFQTKGMEEAMLQLTDLTDSGSYLIFSSYTPEDNDNAIRLFDIANGKVITAIPESLGINQYAGELNGSLLFITDFEASYRKLISLNPKDLSNWHVLIPESGQVLDSACISQDKIIALYYEAAVAKLKIFDKSGKFLQEIGLPGLGTVEITCDPKSSSFFYSYSDFFRPFLLFRYDLEKREQTAFLESKGDVKAEEWVTRQEWVKGKDGTTIPLFLTHKKGLKITENTPVLLFGYGGFAISVTPHFSPLSAVWMNEGGVYAVANLRGGYEFGKTWYETGRLHHKKNVFQDFIDCAEWLCTHQIGSSKTLAIRGQSNGGLLTAACLTMRPDLFGAVIVDKAVLDMLRFHLFTIGYLWKSDYGDPDLPEDYAYLLSYSPYHNLVANKQYPATLVITADHDDRVVPAHSYKFTAALQTAQGGSKPVLLRLEKEEGHKRGACRSSTLSSHLDTLLFLKKELCLN